MKNITVFIYATVIGVIILFIVMTIGGKTNRSMELKSNMPSAVETALESSMVKQNYEVNNNSELLADYAETMAMAVDSNADLGIDVMNINYAQGLLSVKTSEKFKHPNGNDGSVSDQRTVILNKLVEEEKHVYTVRYYKTADDVGITLYKKYEVQEGTSVPVPVDPIMEEKTFSGWIGSAGESLSDPVTADLIIYGEWY